MTTPTYEEVLSEAQQLSRKERERLRAELAKDERKRINRSASKLTPEEAASRLNDLAHRIGAKWQGNGTAVEAVREQRRDL